MRILIVEDEVKIRRGLANLIVKQTGNEIVGEAKNGREGLELILVNNPDLVITDVKMPVMDGLEMLKELSERELHVHSVILSGYSEFEYVDGKAAIHEEVSEWFGGCIILNFQGKRMEEKQWNKDELYGTHPVVLRDVELKAVPYAYWNNRGQGEMTVWMKELL